MVNLEVKLLGGFAAAYLHTPLTFRSDKVRGLLAYLLTRPNEAISRDALATLFFPDQVNRRGRKNLNLLLTRLRQSLAPMQDEYPDSPILVTDYRTVQLNWDNADFWCDVTLSEMLGQECEDHAHEQLETCVDCHYRLRQIVDLYQGDFLAGFGLDDSPAFDEWRLWQQEYRVNEVLTALTLLADHALASGNGPEAEQLARRHLQLSPWPEHPHRQVMQALAQQGKIAAAILHYDLCQKILAEQIGASPSVETRACYQQLLRQATPQTDKPTPRPALPAASPHVSQTFVPPLPQPGTPFFGRTALLEELSQIVMNPAHRIVTLIGAGGMGKTRLAIALAHQLSSQFAHGASFVPLAPITQADEQVMVQVIAAAMGYVFAEKHDPVTQLLNHLQTQHHLLVLDNFEHLLDSAAMVNRLLDAAPNLTILVTSRHPLGLPGEYAQTIKGLQLPRHDDDAAATSVQLFAERANRSGSAFTLDSTTLPYVTRICRFLHGWPLALELAATWINEIPLAEIESTLIQHFARLHTAYRDVADRQKSITAVLSWSYALLTPAAQRLLAQLSIFQGSWTEAAAQAITTAAPSLLHHLHQHTLIERQADGRFAMHELIRQFAQAHLSASDDCTEAHATYYLDWLKAQQPLLCGPEPITILPLVGAELSNIRKAWHWAANKGCARGLGEATAALRRYYTITGLATTAVFDLGAAAEQIEAHATYQPTREAAACLTLAGRLWAEQAVFHTRLGALDDAVAAADRAWGLGQRSQDQATLGQVLCVQGTVWTVRGRSQEALEALTRGTDLARQAGHRRLMVDCLRQLVRPLVQTNAYLDEALQLAHQLNDSWLKNEVIQNAAGVAFYEGQLWQAYKYWQESFTYSRQFANPLTTARLENNMGDLARRFGDYAQAFTYQNAALQTFRAVGDVVMEAHVLEGLTRLYWQTGLTDLAWEMLRSCETICRRRNMVSCLGYLSCTKGRLLAAAGDQHGARAAYREAITCSSASNHPQLAMEAYAGLAEISYGLGELPIALAWCDSILQFLAAGNVLEGFTETAWIYHTCVRVLDALGDKRASSLLDQAQAEIQALARQISHETTHTLFLQVASNQAVMAFNPPPPPPPLN
ncbi:MAG: tetratricopeptide repeat protein [Chloroflexi bacterium]|nr:tetratricopeptide repeat protein [Chloroflexota bacterium]